MREKINYVDDGVNAKRWNGASWFYQPWFVYSIYLAQKVASLAFLLVCFIASNAHAGPCVRNVGGRNMFGIDGVNATVQSSIKSLETTDDSVVESWSLVCEDLCRWVETSPHRIEVFERRWREKSFQWKYSNFPSCHFFSLQRRLRRFTMRSIVRRWIETADGRYVEIQWFLSSVVWFCVR